MTNRSPVIYLGVGTKSPWSGNTGTYSAIMHTCTRSIEENTACYPTRLDSRSSLIQDRFETISVLQNRFGYGKNGGKVPSSRRLI